MLKRHRKLLIRPARILSLLAVLVLCLFLLTIRQIPAAAQAPESPNVTPHTLSPQQTPAFDDFSPIADQTPKAVVIVCADMVDLGMYESIKRRTEIALADGATYLIYQIDTDGGLVDSARSIWDYLMHDVAQRGVKTVAYINKKAFSAGALISVACQDIIMKEAAQIGDCAPIMLGGTIEGVEREKMESPLRSYFDAAANLNGYPAALCRAMVTDSLEIYQVENTETGESEYFEKTDLPSDENKYDLKNKRIIVKEGELLTFTASEAFEHGLSRTVVKGLDDQALEEALVFLENRDAVKFPRPIEFFNTNWSEELVRWLTNPVVAGVLLMIAMIAIYVELNSPGLGLPGAVAVAAFAVLFGSKFLVGMANWWEIAVFFIGLALLATEIFVIPGFGIAGISGVGMIIFSFVAMMVRNAPDQSPIPVSPVDWQMFQNQLVWSLAGVVLFLVAAYFL
ncbi:MAG: hypothetical protein AMJ79_15150, partial [Phycisphaerae bacterium SM23_30]